MTARATDGQITFCLVGSGAVRANPNRAGPCQLLRVGEDNLLFDCGRSAVHNLAKFGWRAEEIDRVFVTHLHFDHVCDLPHLVLLSWNNGRDRALPICGPGGTAEFLEHSVRQAYREDIQSRLGHGKDPAGLQWVVTESLGGETVWSKAGCTVRTLATPHGGITNLNYRIDAGPCSVVITSDTQVDDALVAFSRHVDLLVCECSGPESFLRQQPWGNWHMSPADVAAVARRAEAKHVVLKHLVVDDWSDDPAVCDKMAEHVRAQFGGEVTVGTDGLMIEVHARRDPSPRT